MSDGSSARRRSIRGAAPLRTPLDVARGAPTPRAAPSTRSLTARSSTRAVSGSSCLPAKRFGSSVSGATSSPKGRSSCRSTTAPTSSVMPRTARSTRRLEAQSRAHSGRLGRWCDRSPPSHIPVAPTPGTDRRDWGHRSCRPGQRRGATTRTGPRDYWNRSPRSPKWTAPITRTGPADYPHPARRPPYRRAPTARTDRAGQAKRSARLVNVFLHTTVIGCAGHKTRNIPQSGNSRQINKLPPDPTAFFASLTADRALRAWWHVLLRLVTAGSPAAHSCRPGSSHCPPQALPATSAGRCCELRGPST